MDTHIPKQNMHNVLKPCKILRRETTAHYAPEDTKENNLKKRTMLKSGMAKSSK